LLTPGLAITKHLLIGDQPIADIQGTGSSSQTYFLYPDQLGGTNVVGDSSANTKQLLA
jgi:hypothetical protein